MRRREGGGIIYEGVGSSISICLVAGSDNGSHKRRDNHCSIEGGEKQKVLGMKQRSLKGAIGKQFCRSVGALRLPQTTVHCKNQPLPLSSLWPHFHMVYMNVKVKCCSIYFELKKEKTRINLCVGFRMFTVSDVVRV